MLDYLYQYLEKQYVDVYKTKKSFSSFEVINSMKKTQMDTVSCGLYCIDNIYSSLSNRLSSLTDTDMPLYRKKILYELTNQFVIEFNPETKLERTDLQWETIKDDINPKEFVNTDDIQYVDSFPEMVISLIL